MRSRRLVVVAVLALGGCADLNPRVTQICGNGIVEPTVGEDCDGQEDCIAPGGDNECLWACDEGTPCPDGFGCGVDGACLAPSTAFERGPIVGSAATVWVKAADVDGDGRDDLIHLAGEPGQRQADLTVTFMGPDGLPEQELQWERVEQKVDVADVDGDGLLDLVFVGNARLSAQELDDDTQGALSVLHNNGTRGFDTVVTVDQWQDVQDQARLLIGDAWFPGEIDEWGAHVIDGDQVIRLSDSKVVFQLPALTESPHAFANMWNDDGIAFLTVFKDPSVPDPGPFLYSGVKVRWRDNMAGQSPPTREMRGPGRYVLPWIKVARVNDEPGEASDDVVVFAASRVDSVTKYSLGVALGLRPSTGGVDFEEFQKAAWGYLERVEVLGHGDLNGDGLDDFIFTTGVAVSGDCPSDLTPDDDEGPPLEQCGSAFPYCCSPTKEQMWVWDDVLLGDFNGDDQLDLVGSVKGTPDLEFIFSFQPNQQEYGINRTMFVGGQRRELERVDLNSDGLEDIVIRVDNPGSGEDALKVVFADQALADPQTVLDGLDLHSGLGLDDEESVTVAVSSSGPGLRLGLVSPRLVGGGLFAVPMEPPEKMDETPGSYQNFAAGNFTLGATSTFALGGSGGDTTIAAAWPSLEAGRLVSNPDDGTFVRDSPVQWQRLPGKPFGDEDNLDSMRPELGPALSSMIAADLDGDGLDELVMAGPAVPRLADLDAAPDGGGGVLLVFRTQVDRWELVQDASAAVANYPLGGDFPHYSDPMVLQASDLDGDGDLDIALTTRAGELLLIRNENGRLAPRASALRRHGGWQALTLLGPAEDSVQRVASVVGERFTVSGLDLDDGSLTQQDSHTIPQGSKWADAGDFNGDGLTDVAIAGTGGVILFYGLPN